MPDRFYVTTPIYYVNDAPHVGHAYATVNADALARWHRLIGDDTFFLTGTDEHGLKVAQSAEAAGVTPQVQADINAVRFQETWDDLDIVVRRLHPHDRAPSPRGRAGPAPEDQGQRRHRARHLRGPVLRVVRGVLPGERAGRRRFCPIHTGKEVTILKEENYFFRLSRYEQRLIDWIETNPEVITPEGKRNEVLGFLRQGLQDVSITRTSLDWGVPVPWADGHVFYVWYDALINYATAIGYGTDDERFNTWWPHVHHVIGKEIIRFHCVYWPAMLLAAGLEPPHRVHVHGWLLLGGEKLSKTTHGPARLTDIAPSRLVEDFGVDGVRYHLLRDTPFGPDGDFSYERVVDRYNSDLANNFGNLVSRVATVVAKKCDGIGPAPRPDSPLAAIAAEVVEATTQAWNDVAPSIALEATWRLIRETNGLLEDNEPWKRDAGPDVDAVMGDALEAVRIVSILASPAIPTAAAEAWRRIGLSGRPDDRRVPADTVWGQYPGGLPVEKADPIFPRVKT